MITSLSGTSASIYPWPIWLELESRLQAALDETATDGPVHRALRKFMFFGEDSYVTRRGWIKIPSTLAKEAQLVGEEVEAVASGRITNIEAWNRERFDRLLMEEFTEEDFRLLAEVGI